MRILLFLILTWGVLSGRSAFALRAPRPGLPDLSRISLAPGPRWYRVQTHLHGPYSYDSCDDHGLNPDGSVNQECERDLKDALCANHVDFAFLTDHPGNLNRANYPSVLLARSGDELIHHRSGRAIATRVKCSPGFASVIAPGMEGTLLALGMEWQKDSSWKTVMEQGGSSGVDAKHLFEKETQALVGVPHTESRTDQYLEGFKPDFIEIFNLHASFNPIIRHDFLGEQTLSLGLLRYLFDPFEWFNPDFFILEFVKLSPVYFKKWAHLLSRGIHTTGVAGLDSHQNALRMKTEDGLRLDSHRRLLNSISNWVYASSLDPKAIKSSIRQGRVLVVFELLGTPEGFDFYAHSPASMLGKVRVEMGGKGRLGRDSKIEVKLPKVQREPERILGKAAPLIFADLIRVERDGRETRVLTRQSSNFSYEAKVAGHYRVEVSIVPLHLREEARSERLTQKAYPWLISNPIELN